MGFSPLWPWLMPNPNPTTDTVDTTVVDTTVDTVDTTVTDTSASVPLMPNPKPSPKPKPPLLPNPKLKPMPMLTTDTDTAVLMDTMVDTTDTADTDTVVDTTVDTVDTDMAVMVIMVNFAQDQVTRISNTPRKSGPKKKKILFNLQPPQNSLL